MTTKLKSIDLGALQDTFAKAKAEHASNSKALDRAIEAEGRSKEALVSAREALASATRTILS